jgi:hypothetical protein
MKAATKQQQQQAFAERFKEIAEELGAVVLEKVDYEGDKILLPMYSYHLVMPTIFGPLTLSCSSNQGATGYWVNCCFKDTLLVNGLSYTWGDSSYNSYSGKWNHWLGDKEPNMAKLYSILKGVALV